MRSSHREVMPCIWGAVLVVVARFRAAAVPRLSCACCSSAAISVSSTAIDWPPRLTPHSSDAERGLLRHGHGRAGQGQNQASGRFCSLERAMARMQWSHRPDAAELREVYQAVVDMARRATFRQPRSGWPAELVLAHLATIADHLAAVGDAVRRGERPVAGNPDHVDDQTLA